MIITNLVGTQKLGLQSCLLQEGRTVTTSTVAPSRLTQLHLRWHASTTGTLPAHHHQAMLEFACRARSPRPLSLCRLLTNNSRISDAALAAIQSVAQACRKQFHPLVARPDIASPQKTQSRELRLGPSPDGIKVSLIAPDSFLLCLTLSGSRLMLSSLNTFCRPPIVRQPRKRSSGGEPSAAQAPSRLGGHS